MSNIMGVFLETPPIPLELLMLLWLVLWSPANIEKSAKIRIQFEEVISLDLSQYNNPPLQIKRGESTANLI